MFNYYYEDYNKDTLLTRKEVANILLISESILDLWKAQHDFDLPPVMVRGLIHYRYGDLLTFIEKRKPNCA